MFIDIKLPVGVKGNIRICSMESTN